jgi:ribosomal protein S18 acetylase RimI-like enzyme
MSESETARTARAGFRGAQAPVSVGDRVVVRYLLDDGSATDVLGRLVGADDAHLVVQPDRDPDQQSVPVERSRLVAVKPVPPRRRRPSDVEALERMMAEHWRAPDSDRLGGPEGWLLRAAEGFTNRANSCLVVGDPGVGTEAALAAVRGWYAERGLPPQLAVPAFESPGRNDLRRAGWVAKPGAGAFVYTAPTASLLARARAIMPVRWTREPDREWLDMYHYRGQQLAPIGVRLLLSAPEQAFGSVTAPGGSTVAVLRISAAAGWAGITAVEVDQAYRRRGIATRLVAAAAHWAAERGLERCFLQVGVDNLAAQQTYLKAGFALHHRYDYVAPREGKR